jgi:phenylalanyl-tRNA synthetase beta chain
MLAGIWAGNRSTLSWHEKDVPCDFFDIKGIVEGLFASLGISEKDVVFSRAPEILYPYFKKGSGALVEIKGTCMGTLGEISQVVRSCWGLKLEAFVFDLDMTALHSVTPQSIVSVPLPRYPSVERDLTLIVDNAVAAGDIRDDLSRHTQSISLVEDVLLFDVYQGAPLAEGKKSLSFRIVYRSSEKTLKEKKVKGLHTTISQWLIDKYDADLPA